MKKIYISILVALLVAQGAEAALFKKGPQPAKPTETKPTPPPQPGKQPAAPQPAGLSTEVQTALDQAVNAMGAVKTAAAQAGVKQQVMSKLITAASN